MKQKLGLFLSLSFASFLVSCGGGESSSSQTSGASNGLPFGLPQNASLPAASNVDVVDHQKLKEQLPEAWAGWKRTKHEGKKMEVMGYKMSMAEAQYKGDGGSRLEISISDIAGLVDTARIGVAAWLSAEIDKETDTGYEKTTRFKGYKAHEKVDREDKKASLSVIVADRFVVTARGTKMDLDAVKSAMEKVDLGAIRGLR